MFFLLPNGNSPFLNLFGTQLFNGTTSCKIDKEFENFWPYLGEHADIADKDIDEQDTKTGQDSSECHELRGDEPAGREVLFCCTFRFGNKPIDASRVFFSDRRGLIYRLFRH